MSARIIVAVLVVIAVGWFAIGNKISQDDTSSLKEVSSKPQYSAVPQKTLEPTEKPTAKPVSKPANGLILHSVPFVPQAPTGAWSDERQQDGCEEAASYMAILWAREELPPITASGVEQKLLEISDWEKKEFGDYHDTSVKDTVERIFKGYFKYDNAQTRYDIDAEDIKRELYDGNIVVVPADGRKLNNPYFTPPGPERHNLIVRGYDPKTDEFITNDNGTKRGEGYRYKSSVLLGAIRDYPTGDHSPITESRRTMIVVVKK